MSAQAKGSFYRLYGKRLLDLSLAVPLLVLLLPLMLGVGVFVLVTMGPPVLFRHQRPGLRGKVFTLLKFRTMRNTLGPDGALLPEEERLTRAGALLRRLSLDELPQLLNVLAGQMSLVGPRPLLTEYLVLYNNEQRRRHTVPPGLTGWAQVKGRNALGWKEKFALDVWYADHCSFALDLKILFMTLWVVLGRKGINQSGGAEYGPFRGNDE